MTRRLLLILVAACLFAAKPKDWKSGVLIDAAEEREVAGATSANRVSVGPQVQGCPYCPTRGSGTGATAVVYGTLQGYVIRGDDIAYMVQMRIKTTGILHPTEVRPNVTIGGKVNYAVEKGKFFLKDEDGAEFELVIMKKRLLTDEEKRQIAAPK